MSHFTKEIEIAEVHRAREFKNRRVRFRRTYLNARYFPRETIAKNDAGSY